MKDMIEKTVKLMAEICQMVVETVSATIARMHRDAAEKRQAELAAQDRQMRLRISVLIQRDLARIMQSMIPPDGLTCISDPRNLTFLPDYNNSGCYFSFWWQKTRRKVAIPASTLLALAKRINHRIQQMIAYLRQIGYSDQEIATDYPALYNGFEVADIQDSDEGVIIIVRLY